MEIAEDLLNDAFANGSMDKRDHQYILPDIRVTRDALNDTETVLLSYYGIICIDSEPGASNKTVYSLLITDERLIMGFMYDKSFWSDCDREGVPRYVINIVNLKSIKGVEKRITDGRHMVEIISNDHKYSLLPDSYKSVENIFKKIDNIIAIHKCEQERNRKTYEQLVKYIEKYDVGDISGDTFAKNMSRIIKIH